VPISTPKGKPIAGYDLENPVLLDTVVEMTRGRAATILDVGCDTGRIAATLRREHGQHIIGVDVNHEALLVAAERGVPVVNFDFEQEQGAPFRRKSFDGAILGDVIEHVRHPELLLGQIATLIVPGGFMAISVPNVAFIETRLRLLFGRFDYRDTGTLDWGHLRFFTRSSLVETVRRAGFEVETVKPYTANRSVQFLKPLWTIMPGLFAYQIMVVARNP
jgi:2-polyprenyl-3-methyl-5-hydroxy-6-metoxy-1,4-benzoquinol methylase